MKEEGIQGIPSLETLPHLLPENFHLLANLFLFLKTFIRNFENPAKERNSVGKLSTSDIDSRLIATITGSTESKNIITEKLGKLMFCRIVERE